jgi:hypothetical protein
MITKEIGFDHGTVQCCQSAYLTSSKTRTLHFVIKVEMKRPIRSDYRIAGPGGFSVIWRACGGIVGPDLALYCELGAYDPFCVPR